MFSIYIFHGGSYVKVGDKGVYNGGEISRFGNLDPDRFGYLDLVELVDKLGYVSWDSMYFMDKKTEEFKEIKDDKEVLEMISEVNSYVNVYVDGAKDNVEGKCIDSEQGTEGVETSETEGEVGTEAKEGDDRWEEVIEQADDWSSDDDTEEMGKISDKGKGLEVPSQYLEGDEEVQSVSSASTSSDEATTKTEKKIKYDPTCDHAQLKFQLGMSFVDIKECKDAIRKYSLINGFPIKFIRSNKKQRKRCGHL